MVKLAGDSFAEVANFDMVTPFMSWRLFVVDVRLEKARKECDVADTQARVEADNITKAENENQERQAQLQVLTQEIAELRAEVEVEKDEHGRLQQLWDSTQPELLRSVLSQSLGNFFMLTV